MYKRQVPFQCVMLPLLAEMGKLNMINMPGLMLVNLGFGSSMSIILFHGFMKNVPVELEEAASIDGASPVSYTHLDVYKRQV